MRLGLIGCGRMGKAHLQVALETREVHLAGVADPCLATDQAALPTEASLAALVQRVDLDAVLVAASTPAHEAIVQEALESGLHVLCEKPITLDPERSLALSHMAAETGLIVQVGYWRRFSEPFIALRELIASGRLGTVNAIRTAQWDASPEPVSFCDPQVSGGIEIDYGVHEFDLVRWLLDAEVEAVVSCSPEASPELSTVGDVDTVYGLARLTGKRAMSIDLTRRAGHLDSIRVEVIAEHGSAIVDFALTGTLTVRHGSHLMVTPFAAEDIIGESLKAQLQAFVAGIRSERLHPDAGRPVDCARALEAALALQQARGQETWLSEANMTTSS